MLTFAGKNLQEKLADRGDASGIDFLAFSDNDAAVREDVEKIRSSPFISDDVTVSGYIYEVETGQLRTIVAADA